MKEDLMSMLIGAALGLGAIWYFKSRLEETPTTARVKSVAMGVRG